jgi:hypothetical protein
MRTFLRAAMAALSVASATPAFAGDGEGTIANTQFTLLTAAVAQVPAATPSPMDVAQGRDAASAYAVRSNHVVSLFLPLESGGGTD